MSLTPAEIRRAIEWHREYRSEWDDAPDEYERAGVVGWGRSRRLGIYKSGKVKAYLGVQHVDISRVGWGIADEAHTRFFLSLFRDGVVVTLRTFSRIDEALDALAAFISR